MTAALPAAPTPGRPWVTMTGADGSEWMLSAPAAGGTGAYLQAGPTGWDLAPAQVSVEDYALVDGGSVTKTRTGTRTMVLPVTVTGPTRGTFMDVRRRLRCALDPQRGPVTLRVSEPDGTTRWCQAYYSGGAEGDEGRDAAGRTWVRLGIQLLAPDPYWYGTEVMARFGMLAAGPPFLTYTNGGGTPQPLFPLRINPSLLTDGQTLAVTTEADTWPVWRFTGPFGAALRLTNRTTDKTLTVAVTLGAGDVLEIDTRPGRKRVEILPASGGDPVNTWPAIGSAALWPLVPGSNVVDVSADGATPQSSIELSYVPRYLGY